MIADTDISAEACAAVQVRLRGPLYIALEDWRRSRPKIPARSEALRQLIERALAERELSDNDANTGGEGR
jgi:hypothetical protein